MAAGVVSLSKIVAKVNEALEGVSPEQALRVLQSAAALVNTSFTPANTHATTNSPSPTVINATNEKKLSLVEFVKQKDPRTGAQKIATFAYYLEQFDGASLSKEAIKKCFAKARERVPRNYGRDFSRTIRAGWVHEDGDAVYVTKDGVKAVTEGFGKAAPRGRAVAAKRKRATKSAR